MLHIIAYRDQTGKDYNGLPWFRFASAKKQAQEMALEYKDVVLAECEDEELPETVTWDFIYEHSKPI